MKNVKDTGWDNLITVDSKKILLESLVEKHRHLDKQITTLYNQVHPDEEIKQMKFDKLMLKQEIVTLETEIAEKENTENPEDPSVIKANERRKYTVWVDGTEVTTAFITYSHAKNLLTAYTSDGYDDVTIQVGR